MCFVLQLHWLCKLHKSDTIKLLLWGNTYALGHVCGYKIHFFRFEWSIWLAKEDLAKARWKWDIIVKQVQGGCSKRTRKTFSAWYLLAWFPVFALKVLTLLADIYFQILLLQVSYCENEVDCRRFLQLVHLGEKFDSTNCKNTCDNCSSSKILIDKDVTVIARQLV